MNNHVIAQVLYSPLFKERSERRPNRSSFVPMHLTTISRCLTLTEAGASFLCRVVMSHFYFAEIKATTSPFLFLAVDLPPPPLFQDAVEKNIIPQVGIHSVLAKYDGVNTQVEMIHCTCLFFLNLGTDVVFHTRRNQGANCVDSIVNICRNILLFTTSASRRTTLWKKKTQLS